MDLSDAQIPYSHRSFWQRKKREQQQGRGRKKNGKGGRMLKGRGKERFHVPGMCVDWVGKQIRFGMPMFCLLLACPALPWGYVANQAVISLPGILLEWVESQTWLMFSSQPSYFFNTNSWGCGSLRCAPQSIPKFLFFVFHFFDVCYLVQELLTSAPPSTNPVDFKSFCLSEPPFQAHLPPCRV